jgi:hypothetical protein
MLNNRLLSDSLLDADDEFSFDRNENLRTIQTNLSNQQLIEKGLMVVEQTTFSKSLHKFLGLNQEVISPFPVVFSPLSNIAFASGKGVAVETKPSWFSKFEQRLRVLNETAIEDEIEPSASSRADAKTFAKTLGNTRMPGVFLVGNGNYRLRWENARGEKVGLQFRGNGKVQYLFFKRVGDEMEEMLGTKQLSTLLPFIAACRMRHVINA